MSKYKMKGFPSHHTGVQYKSPLGKMDLSTGQLGALSEGGNMISGTLEGGDPTAKNAVGKAAASGAVEGAMAGAAFGPYGMLIGGAIGGGIGYFEGQSAKEEGLKVKKAQAIEQKKIDVSKAKTAIRDQNIKTQQQKEVGVTDLASNSSTAPPPVQTTPIETPAQNLSALYSPVSKKGGIQDVIKSNQKLRNYKPL